MKQLIVLLLMLCTAGYAFGQQNSEQKQLLLKKSKTEKTIGWILLAGGAACAVTGLVSATSNAFVDIVNGEDKPRGEVAFYTGVTLMAVSVPLFIISKKHEKKAMLVFGGQQIELLSGDNYVVQNIPSLKLRIGL